MKDNTLKLTRYDDEKIASEFADGDFPFYGQELVDQNTNDAKTWLDEDSMIGIVSEIHGGIIGYLHRDHADEITTVLNLHAVDRKMTI
ncbi:hypothetical protein ACPV3A_17115 [Paenibacillus sp. Dod16]|uniref:hypothetical protein n=1 Tax=Paenibacillus sp. Dod16 TaxID=3416392 RepID=UPI003CF90376